MTKIFRYSKIDDNTNREVIMLQGILGRNNLPQQNAPVGNKHGSVKKDDVTSLSSMHYSSDSVSISYKNADGEELSIEMEHVEFKSTNLSRYSDEEKAHWSDVVKQIKEEFEKFKSEGLKGFIETDENGKSSKKDFHKISIDELNKRTDELEKNMPEEWRPDAVSDRILQFVTAFYGRTESKGEDFYKIALDAINTGFKQAGSEMGKLPGDIENIISRTREMVLAKLEKWAEVQGIQTKKEDADSSKQEKVKSGIDITA